MLIILIFLFCITSVNAANQTFTDFQNIIDDAPENTTIELSTDYSFNETTDSSIIISKPITINGNNHVFDGKGKTNIMDISAGNVILNLNTVVQ